MKKLIEEFKGAIHKLHISGFENIDLLLKLTVSDIENKTNLSYQVTPILEKLVQYANLYVHLDEDEQTELFKMNQTDFFSKLFEIMQLSSTILGKLLELGIIHPVLASNLSFEDMWDSQEEVMELLAEMREILPDESLAKECISNYLTIVIVTYQQNFMCIRIPKLRYAMLTENYQMALEELSTYVQKKLELESGIEATCSLVDSYLYQGLLNMKDSECIERLLAKVEESEFDYYGVEEEAFDLDELDNQEYFNLLLLRLDNRYRRQKSAYYFYGEKQKEVAKYHEKCKKL